MFKVYKERQQMHIPIFIFNLNNKDKSLTVDDFLSNRILVSLMKKNRSGNQVIDLIHYYLFVNCLCIFEVELLAKNKVFTQVSTTTI